MKLVSNKKGFTLIELLAVIVILAVIILIAASNIGGMTSKAKKNVLGIEGNTLVDATKTAYQMEVLDGRIQTVTSSACFSLTYLYQEGYFDKMSTSDSSAGLHGNYSGSVLVETSDGIHYNYKFWISNGNYSISDADAGATGKGAEVTTAPASSTCGKTENKDGEIAYFKSKDSFSRLKD